MKVIVDTKDRLDKEGIADRVDKVDILDWWIMVEIFGWNPHIFGEVG